MRLQPQRASTDSRIGTDLLPPGSFIATVMNLAVMAPAQRYRELIADLATDRSALRKAQMVGIRRATTANQARLFGYIFYVIAVTNPARLRQRQHVLIDYL